MKELNLDSSPSGTSKRVRLHSPRNSWTLSDDDLPTTNNGRSENGTPDQARPFVANGERFVVNYPLPLKHNTYEAYKKCFLLYRGLSTFHKERPIILSKNLWQVFFKYFKTQDVLDKNADIEVQDISFVSVQEDFSVIYNFKHFQQTIGRGFICTFCDKNCYIYMLLKTHLKTYHDRFEFQFSEDRTTRTISVNVQLNEKSDTCYEASMTNFLVETTNDYEKRMKQSLVAKPRKRTPFTKVLVCGNLFGKGKGNKTNSKVKQRANTGPIFANFRPTPGSQVFYHSRTLQPITTHELTGIDSEDEDWPDWLQIERETDLDDFVDVNSGEKAFMKIWNSFMFKYNTRYVGRKHLAFACEMFVYECGPAIVEENLILNCMTHFCVLNKKGLIGKAHIVTLMAKIHGAIKFKNEYQVMQNSQIKIGLIDEMDKFPDYVARTRRINKSL